MKVLVHHLRCGNLRPSKRLKRSYLWQCPDKRVRGSLSVPSSGIWTSEMQLFFITVMIIRQSSSKLQLSPGGASALLIFGLPKDVPSLSDFGSVFHKVSLRAERVECPCV